MKVVKRVQAILLVTLNMKKSSATNEYEEVQRQARRLHQGCSRACPGGGTSRTHAARLDIGHLDMYLDTSGHRA